MTAADRLAQARAAFARRMWSGAAADFAAARGEGALDAEDLERLAVAAYMVGRDEDSEHAWLLAHQEWLRRGERERAARCALWQALVLFFRGDLAPAMGWIGRARRTLRDDHHDCVERAWLLMLTALPALFQGDGDGTYPIFLEAGGIAERFGNSDATMFARLGRGHALISQGCITEGTALLDEVMVAVTADEVSPVLVGIAYCQVIALCHDVFDLRRAREWTDALSRWCESQPDLVPFRGNCLVHRCEIFQLQGAWRDALEAAQRACEWLVGPPAWDTLGSAFYQLGEIQRLRGEFSEAEAAYRRASHAGREPEPGMSLLHFSRGRLDLALAAMRRLVAETPDPMERVRLLPAYVEIALAADEVGPARAAAAELAQIAARHQTPYLQAVAETASGAVLLAGGDSVTALTKLRSAQNTWHALGTPYQAARVRVLRGVACLNLADSATARREFEAARQVFEELGAAPDLERVARLMGSPKGAGVLSRREKQVLSLVADGKPNRAIAAELVISEKTVARHLSGIFTKLSVSSRAEATAYAFKHGLVH